MLLENPSSPPTVPRLSPVESGASVGTPPSSSATHPLRSSRLSEQVSLEREQSDARAHTHIPCSGLSCDPAGSVFRDEFDLAILQLQENNRLEILKRKWWEGGRCPKEEDHRAKGKDAPALQDKAARLWYPGPN